MPNGSFTNFWDQNSGDSQASPWTAMTNAAPGSASPMNNAPTNPWIQPNRNNDTNKQVAAPGTVGHFGTSDYDSWGGHWSGGRVGTGTWNMREMAPPAATVPGAGAQTPARSPGESEAGDPYYEHQEQGNFDAAAYLAANPDVAASGMDPWTHWTMYGANEGRNYTMLQEFAPISTWGGGSGGTYQGPRIPGMSYGITR